ncbi:MAG: DUF47 family protein [Peptococcaceae bacterium]|nr:DUF47 family protein [Peptococcaceae bacterium]
MLLLKPKENDFYVLLRESADQVVKSSLILSSAIDNPATISEKMAELNETEHTADEITKAIIIKLNKTLVTPMDREDIYSLATIMDDLVDFIQGALERMIMYKAVLPIHGARELIKILNDCVLIIKESIDCLSSIKTNFKNIMINTDRIHNLETEGDKLYRQEVAKLFEEDINPVEIIKWKEILEHLEDAIDRCEDLSDTLKGVVLKYV